MKMKKNNNFIKIENIPKKKYLVLKYLRKQNLIDINDILSKSISFIF